MPRARAVSADYETMPLRSGRGRDRPARGEVCDVEDPARVSRRCAPARRRSSAASPFSAVAVPSDIGSDIATCERWREASRLSRSEPNLCSAKHDRGKSADAGRLREKWRRRLTIARISQPQSASETCLNIPSDPWLHAQHASLASQLSILRSILRRLARQSDSAPRASATGVNAALVARRRGRAPRHLGQARRECGTPTVPHRSVASRAAPTNAA